MAAQGSHSLRQAESLLLLAKQLHDNSDPSQDDSLRTKIVLQAKQLIAEVQNPFDHILDQVFNSYVVGATLALLKLGAFDSIPERGVISLSELARCCETSETLISRLMRQLTCTNIFVEEAPGLYAHSPLSIVLSCHQGPFGRNFYEVVYEEMYPPMLNLHEYLKATKNQGSVSYTDNAHAYHNDMIGKNFWQILDTDPRRVQKFNSCLQTWSAMHPVVALFPFTAVLAKNNSANRPLIVDIGGGKGQALQLFKADCPELRGQCVLQDRPEVINGLKDAELSGITMMAHDFFTEQPIKNAQVYYIRRVMHDWLDPEASLILKQIKPAMGPDSRIIVADMVIPERPTLSDAHAVWLDLMLMTINGMERTKADWERLAELSGLKLVRLWHDPEQYGPLCVVEYMLPEANVLNGNHAYPASMLPMGLDGACDMDLGSEVSNMLPDSSTTLRRSGAATPITTGCEVHGVGSAAVHESERTQQTSSQVSLQSVGHIEQENDEVMVEAMSPRRFVEVGG